MGGPFCPAGSHLSHRVAVKLNTGEMGIISDPNIGHIGRPVVRIYLDEEGNPKAKPNDVDLAEAGHQHRLVVQVSEY